MNTPKTICVYCASSSKVDARYKSIAREIGALLAGRGVRIVYGGGHVGLMGIMADAALEAGGEVVGVIPDILVDKEVAHKGLTEMHITRDMQERQAKMADLADAFVVLPGGLGTLAEFFEAVTWKSLGIQDKPIAFYDPGGYWDPLIAMLEKAQSEKFLYQSCEGLFEVCRDMDALLGFLFSGQS